jgi:hypothetical protein
LQFYPFRKGSANLLMSATCCMSGYKAGFVDDYRVG